MEATLYWVGYLYNKVTKEVKKERKTIEVIFIAKVGSRFLPSLDFMIKKLLSPGRL